MGGQWEVCELKVWCGGLWLVGGLGWGVSDLGDNIDHRQN